jgi:predicted metalloprotease
MRIDELPKSDRIEDRRGGLSGIPGGRGGLGMGTIVVLGLIGWALGIDPRVLIEGAETISAHPLYSMMYRPAPLQSVQ